MPYMSGFTNDVEKALFLRRFGVPFWALAYVFGRDDNYWYRMTAGLGRDSIVDTTVMEADKLPEHVCIIQAMPISDSGHADHVVPGVIGKGIS